MTLLGKIFTVLIMLMSVVFMSFTVVVYATHTNWKDRASALEAQLQQQQQRNAELQSRETDLRNNLAMEQTARKFVLASLAAKLQQAQQELQEKERNLDNLQAAEGQAAAALRVALEQLQAVTTEIAGLRTDVRDSHQDRDNKFQLLVALTDQFNQVKRLSEQLEQRQGPLVAMLAGYESILRKLGVNFEAQPDGTVVSDVNRDAPDIEGNVVAVDDTMFVEINLGADDGLKIGHHLDVYRDRAYLGRVIIRRTEPDNSVAEIIPEYRRGLIRKGDRVATKLS